MAVIGIDLGARACEGITLCGRATGNHPLGGPTRPALGRRAAGQRQDCRRDDRRNDPVKFPHNTIVEVKRKVGTTEKVPLGDKLFSPQDISAMILSRIKELAEAELGEPITGAVITCPAYFKDPPRAATEQAGQLAGLKVLQIMNEPTAAAYAYGLQHGNDKAEKLFIIYDLGGGTFDVTVIRTIAGSLKVIGTGGDPQLGGGDFDDRIVEWIVGHIRQSNPAYAATWSDEKLKALKLRLKFHAEEYKKKLCDSRDAEPSVTFTLPNLDIFEGQPVSFNGNLTMVEFERMIMDLMDNSKKWVDEAMKEPTKTHGYTLKDVTAILLVGGSTRVPLVRRKLKEWYPVVPSWGEEKGINPDEIVALGAASGLLNLTLTATWRCNGRWWM